MMPMWMLIFICNTVYNVIIRYIGCYYFNITTGVRKVPDSERNSTERVTASITVCTNTMVATNSRVTATCSSTTTLLTNRTPFHLKRKKPKVCVRISVEKFKFKRIWCL